MGNEILRRCENGEQRAHPDDGPAAAATSAYRGEFLVEETGIATLLFHFQLQKGNARKQAEVANIVSSRVVACAAHRQK